MQPEKCTNTNDPGSLDVRGSRLALRGKIEKKLQLVSDRKANPVQLVQVAPSATFDRGDQTKPPWLVFRTASPNFWR